MLAYREFSEGKECFYSKKIGEANSRCQRTEVTEREKYPLFLPGRIGFELLNIPLSGADPF